jgi:hypothetical protein
MYIHEGLFVNTHVHALYSNTEKMINKLTCVIVME